MGRGLSAEARNQLGWKQAVSPLASAPYPSPLGGAEAGARAGTRGLCFRPSTLSLWGENGPLRKPEVPGIPVTGEGACPPPRATVVAPPKAGQLSPPPGSALSLGLPEGLGAGRGRGTGWAHIGCFLRLGPVGTWGYLWPTRERACRGFHANCVCAWGLHHCDLATPRDPRCGVYSPCSSY